MLLDFAQYIRGQHGAIIERWLEAVRADAEIPSAQRLTETELRDHLDGVLSKLADQLARTEVMHRPEEMAAPAEAKLHGVVRSRQDYQVGELAREVLVLRASFMEIFSTWLKERRQIATEDFLETSKLVHRFFDEICSESVAAYVRQRDREAEHSATGLRELNEALERTNRQYEQADSYRRKTLRTVAHEMATPVNALGLGVTYLAESEDPAEKEEAKGLVLRTLEHLRTMLDQLVDFARSEGGIERLQVTEFEVRPIFHYLVAGFEPLAAAKNLRFEAELDPELKTVRSDENKVQRVAVNLLSNAIKYCENGAVSLTLRGMDAERWAIEVVDTGCGIPREEFDRIFGEFERLGAHANQPGLGLGLSIVRTLVSRLGGEISLESNVGDGSKFLVVLPRALAG
jgi:signal transduction histidine kinase